jgi:hypothetical protein
MRLVRRGTVLKIEADLELWRDGVYMHLDRQALFSMCACQLHLYLVYLVTLNSLFATELSDYAGTWCL